MENATNGLMMAGGILIGILVVSLFVYMFTTIGGISKDFQEDIDATAIQKFNEPFERYINREDLGPHDLLTIQNLVDEVNEQEGRNWI